MGAWGTGIRDNDTAMDFMCNLVVQGILNANSNEEYLVVLEIALEYGCISADEKPMYLKAINEEITNIDNWREECRGERLLILENLKNEILRLE